MQKHLLYINLFTITSALAFGACVDEVENVVTPDVPEVGEKTPIELTVGGEEANPLTRAVISDGEGKTLVALPKGTSLYMLMKGEDVTLTTAVTYSRTVGFAQDISENTTKSDVSFTASNEGAKFTRYWEDVYSRNSALSIVAVCTPGYGPSAAGASKVDQKTWKIGGDASFVSNTWGVSSTTSDNYPQLYWPVNYSTAVTDQSQQENKPDFISFQDLCFSNNVGKYKKTGDAEVTDNRIKFNTTTKKFGTGNLVFYHALSKLTFRIIEGDGFETNEFAFKPETNIKLSNFYNGGTFNIENGEFLSSGLIKTDITKIYQRALTTAEAATYKYILDALVIPGTDLYALDAATTNAVTFYIGENEYKLSMAQLYEAFSDTQKSTYFDSGKLKAGVHYIFTFKVGKTKIEKITAQLLPWEVVTAELEPSNARIQVAFEERVTAVTIGIDLYRAKDTGNSTISDTYQGYTWPTGYTTDGKAKTNNGPFAYSSANGYWSTDWYWPDNTTFYHLRAVAPTTQSVTAATVDYTSLESKENKSASDTYTDVQWGAPFKDIEESAKLKYDPTTYGFDGVADHQISYAVGPTDKKINLLLFHMMSDVTFIVKTTTGDDKVILKDASNVTSIELQNYCSNGKVELGNGRVVPTVNSPKETLTYGTGTYAAASTGVSDSYTWNAGIVPQSLSDVILVITTADKNQYKVALKDVAVDAVPTTNIENPYKTKNSSNKYIIDYWYPGFKYTYTFTLKKTGIDKITATIIDWESISADDTVQIQ